MPKPFFTSGRSEEDEYLLKLGFEILLISLIHGNNTSNMLDQHSLFLILESLNRLDPVYLDNFVFETREKLPSNKISILSW